MDEMERQLTQSFTLRMRDCDAHGRWKRSSLLKEMQELGEDHSSVLGFPGRSSSVMACAGCSTGWPSPCTRSP